MDFDPTRPPTKPREAAAVILVRAGAGRAAEVLLVRREAKAAFMARSFVFPGGVRDGEEDLRATAARELFEEAGVLLADRPVDAAAVAALRARSVAGTPLEELLAEAGLRLDLERLVPFAHWVTPSAEKRRFSARFFVAELPPGQEATPDGAEVVESQWATPKDALARSDELLLPPPQLRTVWELRGAATPIELLALARARSPHVRALVPRFAPLPETPHEFALLLPWDPDHDALGTGDASPWPADHPLAGGPSRFVREGAAWRQLDG
jgi:8-oxo-dGTP pyrophosphatase MutT (NUDIX family)